ncbi:arginine utilization regulatory protein [Desulfotomaculum arcticum]|uniref:Arginine utilization regulatory protein n=1 Tax=Desulfotruncus arcticus DSM 17038 TaxID=1121424 RepID=A0A1I2PZG2_9FIRM|nr:sigma 54-interacting transcriptional regulator [Desulfotruncus arcticus]SFG21408.1 arginine utilization regulatory protein [Desulfotomaculum arcticum] [Desulfotruncus arcticus DSM 17038]
MSKNKGISSELIIEIFNSLPQGVIILDKDYHIIDINQKAQELLVTSKVRALGKPLKELCQQFFVQDNLIQAIVDSPKGVRVKISFIELNKTDARFMLFLEPESQFNMDILTTIINSIDDAFLVVDEQGRIIEYNDALQRLDGLLKEQVLGKHLTSIYNLSESKSFLLQAIRQRKPILDRYQNYTTISGKNLSIMCSTFPLFKNNKVIGAVSIMKDYSKIKELSDKIVELQGQLFNNNSHLKKSSKTTKYSFDDIIGASYSIKQTIKWAKRAARSSSHVLIYGKTGTGKELFAQSIHNASPRANNPFIAINCAAIPENLLEGILFGTVKGAYTGAVDRPGLFEQANRGTLLLDEINSMSIGLQAKILRVLQEGMNRRLGDIHENPVDVRIISNINVEPAIAIKEKQLREDLYYRLSAVYLEIPLLSERKEDIPLLTDAFIKKYNNLLCKNIMRISEESMNLLINYSWPGNVRELQHAIESAMNLIKDEETVLLPKHFPPHIKRTTDGISDNTINITIPLQDEPLAETLSKLERVVISHVLEKNKWNISRTARKLDIKRQSLQYRIRKYDIK